MSLWQQNLSKPLAKSRNFPGVTWYPHKTPIFRLTPVAAQSKLHRKIASLKEQFPPRGQEKHFS
jgi:hypothetical protein